MNRNTATIFVLLALSLAAATYVASCHCGPPSDSRPPTPVALRPPSDLAQSRHALTSTVTTDADFQTANRGYGIVEDTSISAGNIRRTLGLPNFGLANVNPTVTWWQTTTGFTTGRYGHTSVVHKGYLYVLGGCSVANCSSALNDVQFARINADGTVGSWTTSGNQFTTGRIFSASVVYNGYVYVVGGLTAVSLGSNLADVQYSRLNDDGSVGTWATTASFTDSRRNHTVAAYNGYLYVVGGHHETPSADYNDVQVAKIRPDGSLDPFVTYSNQFTTPRANQTSVAYKGYIYVIGGYKGPSGPTQGDVQFAKLNADGSPGTWTTATNTFTTPRYSHTSVAYNDRLYVLGGVTGGYANDVQFATINDDGSLGTWTTSTPTFTNPRYAHTTVVSNGFIYVMGGHGLWNDVQFAPIRPDGHVGTTWVKATNLQEAVSRPATVIYDGYLYVSGGATMPTGYSNAIRYATVLPDGTAGALQNLPNFTQGRALHTMHAHNDYLYIVGGQKESSGLLIDIQYTKIKSGGSIDPWSATADLPAPRSGHTSVIHNNRLYVIGGWSNERSVVYTSLNQDGTISPASWQSGPALPGDRIYSTSGTYNGYLYVVGGSAFSQGNFDTVYVSKINADGSLNNWTTTTPFNTARTYHIGAIVNGYLYIGLGDDGTNVLNDIQHAKLNADGTITPGGWSQTTTLTNGRRAAVAGVNNGFIFILGGCTDISCTTPPNEVIAAPINANGTVGEWKQATAMPFERGNPASTITNGYLYVLGGWNYPTHYLDAVSYANIQPSGEIGAWSSTINLPTPRDLHSVVSLGGKVYSLGGRPSDGVRLNEVVYTSANTDGTLGNWNSTIPLSSGLNSHSSASYDGKLYVLGGYNGGTDFLTDVKAASLLPGGAIDSWTPTTGFSTARTGMPTAIANGRVYVYGGTEYSGNRLNDVQYATVNEDGSIGPWSYTTAFANGRGSFPGNTYNGFLYLFGGYLAPGTFANDVQFAAVNESGTIGTWRQTSAFANQRYGHASAVYNGYAYVVGGSAAGTTIYNDVQFATIVAYSTSTRSVFSKQFDLGAAGTFNSVTVKGVLGGVNSQVSVKYRLAGADAIYGAWSAGTDLAVLPGTVNIPSGAGRYIEVALTIDDNGRLGVTSGMGSSEISEIAVVSGKTDGSACTVNGDCLNNNCVNLVCCNNACNSPGLCEAAGSCATGTCTYPADTGANCDDTNSCTHTDKCAANKLCGGTGYACTPTECQATSACNGAGGCTVTNKLSSVTCTIDALACTDDHCDGSGACVHTVQAGKCLIGGNCVNSGDTNPSILCSWCDPSSNPNGWTYKPSTEACDDSLACTHTDKCNGTGGCAGTSFTCTSTQCQATSVCNGAGGCTVTNKANTETCDDGNAATKNDKCDGSGGCAGTPYTCTPSECEATSVTNGTDCSVTYRPNSFKCWAAVSACWQDSYCTGTTATCPANTPKSNTSICDDSNACTHTDKCDGAGGCAGTAYACTTPGACQLAAGAVCNGDGTCTYQPDPACQDGGTPDSGTDAGTVDDTGVIVDAGADAGTTSDTGVVADSGADVGTADDTGVAVDAGADAGFDAGTPDTGTPDAGTDVGTSDDAGVPVDAGTDSGFDTGTPDTGTPDTGMVPDAGQPVDTGVPDAGTDKPKKDAGSEADTGEEKEKEPFGCACSSVSI